MVAKAGARAGAGTETGDGDGDFKDDGNSAGVESRGIGAAACVRSHNITVPGMMIGGGHFVGGWRWRIDGEAGRAFSVIESRQVVSRASSCTSSKASFSFRRISRC